METLVQLTDPVEYPVTVAEARTQCALYDDTTHDTLLAQLIKAATAEVERYTGCTIMQRSMRLDMDGFQSREIDLGTYPVQSVTSVTYDTGGSPATATVDSADYWVHLVGEQPRVKAETYWPATETARPGSARVTFVAGYAGTGDSPVDRSNIPEDLRQGILVRVYELWMHRESSSMPASTLLHGSRRW